MRHLVPDRSVGDGAEGESADAGWFEPEHFRVTVDVGTEAVLCDQNLSELTVQGA